MARRFAGKVALVTGGATGIGRATALAFAAEGARVVVADILAAGAETVAAIRAVGGEATYVCGDVAEPADVASMIAAAVRWGGRIDCAFNNAGIEGVRAPLTEQPDDAWARVIAVNLSGVRHCLKQELAHMRKREGGGAIVNCASILGHVAYEQASAYVAAKHGVIGLTRAAALEVAPHGIRVNAVSPAFIETPMLARAGVLDSAETRAAAAALHPLGRLGHAEEVAAATLFLCSDDASFVTGHALAADGGYLCR
jgi:NAD(P)-dependent dehydrogenase (short-subunit alcohol dehydrogenase family)